jgi:hypothetical protein
VPTEARQNPTAMDNNMTLQAAERSITVAV